MQRFVYMNTSIQTFRWQNILIETSIIIHEHNWWWRYSCAPDCDTICSFFTVSNLSSRLLAGLHFSTRLNKLFIILLCLIWFYILLFTSSRKIPHRIQLPKIVALLYYLLYFPIIILKSMCLVSSAIRYEYNEPYVKDLKSHNVAVHCIKLFNNIHARTHTHRQTRVCLCYEMHRWLCVNAQEWKTHSANIREILSQTSR